MDPRDVEAFVIDLDGVVYRGDKAIAGAPEALRALRDAGKRMLFLTNNSTRPERDVVTKLRRMGIDAGEEEVLTSARVTTDVMLERNLQGCSVFVIGGAGIRGALEDAGFKVAEGEDGSNSDVVVVGGDPMFTYDDMRIAANALRAGAAFIATNDDRSYPAPRGLIPGAGAIVKAIEFAAERDAEVLGKPNAPMMHAARRRLTPCTNIAIVGDQPATDLVGGRLMGWWTTLVLSGVTSREEAEELDPQPDLITEGLAELAARVIGAE